MKQVLAGEPQDLSGLNPRSLRGTISPVLNHAQEDRNDMVKHAVAAHSVDLEPIDRLEEKITRLVSMVVQLRAELAKAVDDNARQAQEIDALRARLEDADAANTELLALRDERDVIRSRVSEMLQQLEAI